MGFCGCLPSRMGDLTRKNSHQKIDLTSQYGDLFIGMSNKDRIP